MLSSLRQCAGGIRQPFNVKVTLDGQTFELTFCVRSMSHTLFEGFFFNLAHMFSSLKQCAKGIDQPFKLKVKVNLNVKWLSLPFISAPYLPNSLNVFHKTWFKCSDYWDDVQKAWVTSTSIRLQIYLHVKIFHVQSLLMKLCSCCVIAIFCPFYWICMSFFDKKGNTNPETTKKHWSYRCPLGCIVH